MALKSLIALVVLALVAVACGASGEPRAAKQTPQRSGVVRSERPGGTALAALDALKALAVKGRAPKTGYDRGRFGNGWASLDGGCDTHGLILKRDLVRKAFERGDRCEVARGRLADPYTAVAIAYARGGPVEVDVDHVVALSDAWQKGAQRWSDKRRIAFANDPLNLLAVDASANRQKGDGDAATWLPPNKRFRCAYVARQIAVKKRYGAWVTRAEREAMRRVLSTCPHEPLPVSGRARVPIVTRARPRAEHFANCDAVRAAGQAPLHAGDPAYEANPALDRDEDGVACE